MLRGFKLSYVRKNIHQNSFRGWLFHMSMIELEDLLWFAFLVPDSAPHLVDPYRYPPT